MRVEEYFFPPHDKPLFKNFNYFQKNYLNDFKKLNCSNKKLLGRNVIIVV